MWLPNHYHSNLPTTKGCSCHADKSRQTQAEQVAHTQVPCPPSKRPTHGVAVTTVSMLSASWAQADLQTVLLCKRWCEFVPSLSLLCSFLNLHRHNSRLAVPLVLALVYSLYTGVLLLTTPSFYPWKAAWQSDEYIHKTLIFFETDKR